jgi:thioredoxin reductase (NADPH)
MSPDLVVVGAGPAGASAALWARALDLSVCLLEAAPRPGGQLHAIHFEPGNLVGSIPGEGAAIAGRLAEQLKAAHVEVRFDAPALRVDAEAMTVHVAGGAAVSAAAVLVATGLRRRRLGVSGESELEGRGVSHSATRDRARFAGQEVVVVGGGDAAFENALLLAEVGCPVTIVVREAPVARREFRDRVAAEPRIEVLDRTRVAAILGDGQVSAVRLEGERGRFELPVAGVVVKVGAIPNSEWLAGTVDLDDRGYVLVDDRFGTSQPRIWAVGDVIRPAPPGIAVAIGQGALAVAAIRAVLREP